MHQVVSAHTYFFWVSFHPSSKFLPKKLEWEPHNRPHFLPIAKPHPLKALTCDPPPMYWLGTSRWCSGPLCMLHSVWICFFLAFTSFPLPLHLFNSDVRASWCFIFCGVRMCGLLGSYFLPFIPSCTGYRLGITLHLLAKPVFFLLYDRGPFGH